MRGRFVLQPPCWDARVANDVVTAGADGFDTVKSLRPVRISFREPISCMIDPMVGSVVGASASSLSATESPRELERTSATMARNISRLEGSEEGTGVATIDWGTSY